MFSTLLKITGFYFIFVANIYFIMYMHILYFLGPFITDQPRLIPNLYYRERCNKHSGLSPLISFPLYL